ncbi:MAG TPA: YbhB/YbcL family Raf kinase inhibitor-like protein [Kofleriaceae bacterium]
MLEKLPVQVGHALRRARAGLQSIASHSDALAPVPATIQLASPAFVDGAMMPSRFTADGIGTSPPLVWTTVPGARSVALLVEDADSPTPRPLVHAIAWQLSPVLDRLEEGELRTSQPHPSLGLTSYLKPGWLPPDPPPGHGPHRYAFQLFALDHDPDLGEHPGRRALLAALRGHTLARGLLIGLYERD